MSWVRVARVTEGLACSGSQIGDGYAAIWVQAVDGSSSAVVTRTFYRAEDGGREYLECQTEYLLTVDGEAAEAAFVYTNCGDVDSNAEVYIAAHDAPEPTDEEWVAALADQLAAA